MGESKCATCKKNGKYDATGNPKDCFEAIQCINNDYSDYEKEDDEVLRLREEKEKAANEKNKQYIERNWFSILLGLVWLVWGAVFIILLIVIIVGTLFHGVGYEESFSSTIQWSFDHYAKFYKCMLGFIVYEIIYNIYRLFKR